MKQISIFDKQIRTGDGLKGVQSVIRALDILEIFPSHGPELGLSAISDFLQLNKTTTYRLLSTLESRGYIEKLPVNRKYRLGVRAFELGTYFQSQLNIRKIALPLMIDLSKQTGEAVFLCIRENDEALCIERVESDRQVNIFTLRVGGRQPLHCGAAPRALLAGMSHEEIEEYVKRTGLPPLSNRTLSSLDELISDTMATQKNGYVVSEEDVVAGISAVGAPILDLNGKVIAAISLSGLSNRFQGPNLESLRAEVVQSARKISLQFGHREK